MTSTDPHTLTGAYSMDALPEAERREFERHLARCESCAVEVRELTATAERLALAAAAPPPSQLRRQVLREIAEVRQEPPPVSRTRRLGSRLRPGARALPMFALAASLAAALFGGVAVWQYESAQDARQHAEQREERAETLARVLSAPDARVRSGALPEGGTASVVVSRDADRAAFFAADLPRAPEGKVYQLWFSEGGTMRPAGLLSAAERGATVLMDGPVRDASAMGLTVEPDGGSPQPTSEPLTLLRLTGASGQA
ncbi:anti-sigma factor [Streptomyces oceani]|uniref:Regulator of SigK n=1 Tax=Streptomyces oceani TaxID=1075402 RepID=A0A1E7KJV2_9ACTN|nr:anti-sigma factor [Streptomyces oceani]OEV04173.1 anti-sigma factor [Streptomyces oceani]